MLNRNTDMDKNEITKTCSASKKCGGCRYLGISYKEQLRKKQKYTEGLLGGYGKVLDIEGMDEPYYYRNKVHHALGRDKKGNVISGSYEESTHKIVPTDTCLLEDKVSGEIIRTVRKLLTSFKIQIFNEKSGYGLVRHVLVRRGFATGEVMVVLIAVSPVFPSKNNFVKALRKEHPEIKTVILNVNDRFTSMVLGKRNITLYGDGYISDILCGRRFRISPSSFYQINPVQTKKLYETAIEYAGLTGKETVIDAYCGIGTIGLCASDRAAHVIGVELNKDAVKDAIINSKDNKITNARFYPGDAGEFMTGMAAKGERADVVFMDPPRSGSTKEFMDAMIKMSPDRIVYISCNPATQADDLQYLTKHGYKVRKIKPFDLFPWTEHVESCVLLERVSNRKADSYVKLNVKMEDYYRIKLYE